MGFAVFDDTIYSHARYTAFYDLELADFADDLPFYQQHLPKPQSRVLELGCGSGRLVRALTAAGHQLIGIDLSLAMLRKAVARTPADAAPAPHYLCMDMTRLSLAATFDAVLIPYNTINLLSAAGDVDRCLAQARELLDADGRLLMQLFVPAREHLELAEKKQFQFRIFDCPDGSKVIKEILKWREPDAPLINLKETFRIRYRPDKKNEDWQYHYQILALEYADWQAILAAAGFRILAAYGDYELTPFVAGHHSTLLIAAAPC